MLPRLPRFTRPPAFLGPGDVDVAKAHAIWIEAERIKRIADKLVGFGPMSIGLDGLLAPVPIAGTVFSLGAGLWLIWQGILARASWFTLARMLFYVGFRTAASIVPMEGWLVDILFRGHMHAANALQKDIAARFGAPADAAIARVRRNPFSRPRSFGAGPLAAAR
jgi:hypothetical protein